MIYKVSYCDKITFFPTFAYMDFKITSKYKPTGDQPEAIKQLTDGVLAGDNAQVLLGVTGSGKRFLPRKCG